MILNPNDKNNKVFVSADNAFVTIFNPIKDLNKEEKIFLLAEIKKVLRSKSKTLKK